MYGQRLLLWSPYLILPNLPYRAPHHWSFTTITTAKATAAPPILPPLLMPSKIPQDGPAEDPSRASPPKSAPSRFQDIFAIPAPVKKLFDRVPLVTYAPNPLPERSPKPSKIPSLYIFSTDRDAAAGRPSFNPSCLKWQVRLPRPKN